MSAISSINKISVLGFAFGHKPKIFPTNKFRIYIMHATVFFKKLFKKSVKPFNPPRLRQVQIVDYLSFDNVAFSRSYSVVQVRDVLKNELMNVYDIQLRYMNGGVYLLKEGDSLL